MTHIQFLVGLQYQALSQVVIAVIMTCCVCTVLVVYMYTCTECQQCSSTGCTCCTTAVHSKEGLTVKYSHSDKYAKKYLFVLNVQNTATATHEK